MKKRILGMDEVDDSKNLISNQEVNPTNEEVIERLKIAMQKNIEKYGIPDSRKMERKFYFIDLSEYFKKLD